MMSNPEQRESTEHRILPIGSVLGVDNEGYLVGQSGADKIVAPWDEPVAAIRDAAVEYLGDELHRVYVRGSVSRGAAIEGVSDIDSIIVVKNDPDIITKDWRANLESQIALQYPIVKGLDFSYQDLATVMAMITIMVTSTEM